ncbi:MAG: Gx transporter family protein [Gammaproteobacteria bacterium]
MEIEVTAEDARSAGLAARAIAIHVVEANLPSPLPGVKPGLANVVTLAALAHMAGQFALAYWVLIPHPGLLRLRPVLMTAALVFGISGGIIARAMVGGMGGCRAQA